MEPEVTEGTVTVLFTDVVGSTDMVARVGDTEARGILGAHEAVVRRVVAEHRGREVKSLGDGFMVAFASARGAVAAAVAIQRALAEHARAHPERAVRVRMGLNTGDVLLEGGDLYGQAVHAAARVAGQAQGGQILATEVVRQLAGRVPEVTFADRGRHRLKGFPERLRLYEIGWTEPAGAVGVAQPALRTAVAGRARETALLREGLAEATVARSRLFVLSGDAGIGKTFLADVLAEQAREEGFAVAWGRCWDSGGAPAYWPWLQILRGILAQDGMDAALARAGAAAAYLAQVVPDIRQRLPDLAPTPVHDPDQARFALFDAAAGFLREAAAVRPLLLIFDDIQAADVPTLLLLRFLARAARDTRLLVVATHRDSDAVAADVGEALAGLGREAVHLPLTGLDTDGIGVLVATATGAPAEPTALAALADATGGNPLFLRELLRELAASGRSASATDLEGFRIPQGIRAAILARVSRVDPAVRDLLVSAAVVGRDFSLLLVAHVLAVPPARALELVRDAIAAGLLADAGSAASYRFAHALVRDVCADSVAPHERMRLHGRVAETLEALHGGRRDEHAAELARHHLAAAPLTGGGPAVQYFALAGERALALLAHEDAADHFRRALEVGDAYGELDGRRRAELILRRAEAELRCGRRSAAREHFGEADAAAAAVPWPAGRARAAVGLSATGEFGVADAQAIRLLDAVLAGGDELPPADAVAAHARLAMALLPLPTAAERRAEVSARAVELARQAADDGLLAFALSARLYATWGPDGVAERLAGGEEILRLAVAQRNLERELEGHQWRLSALLDLGDIPRADQEIDAYMTVAQELKQPQFMVWAANRRKMRALLAGRYAEAESWSHRMVALGREADDPGAELDACIGVCLAQLDQGRTEELAASLRDLEGHARRLGSVSFQRALVPRLQWAVGRDADARAEFEELALAGFAAVPRDFMWLAAMALLAELAVGLGDRARAAELYDLLGPYEGRNVMASAGMSMGSAARYLGLLAGCTGRTESAVAHLERAVRANAEMGARPWTARAQAELAAALLARAAPGDAERADAVLSEARATAADLGMPRPGRPATAAPTGAARRRAAVRREGEYWSFEFESRVFRLKDAKGLGYLARLLAAPGVEIHVLDLTDPGPADPDAAGVARREGLRTAADPGEALDPQARAAYRRRLADLREEAEEATRWGDPERAARARAEMQFLADELARAMGLGGRARATGTPAERARVAVTRAIRGAIERIEAADGELGAHLTRSVRTGAFCSYTPEPALAVLWEL